MKKFDKTLSDHSNYLSRLSCVNKASAYSTTTENFNKGVKMSLYPNRLLRKFASVLISIPILSFSSDSSWLKDYQKNGGVFKPEIHAVYPNVVMKPSGFVVASISLLYKTIGSTRKPLDWADIQPKLVNRNTPQAVAMAEYKEYAHFAGNFMIFHLFAVPKVLVGFSDEDRAMIASKWGIETHHIPKDGDYVELIYSTENRWPGSPVSHHKITVNHKKIAELGSLSAYLKHKGFAFTPSSVEFVFENKKIDFNSRRDKIEMFNYVFNFLANDYTYRLGNQASADTNFRSDWKRIYNYTLGKHSPQFSRAGVLAGHKHYKNALAEGSKIHKFSFSKEGGVGGANIDGEEFYVLEDILIPKKDLDWRKAEVTIHRGNTYYKQERKWVGGTRKHVKGESMSGDDVFMYLKARLNGFKDFSNGASSADLTEPVDPDENTDQRGKPKKQYEFHFYKEGGLGGNHFDHKFYIDINGLYVLRDDIENVPGKWNTFKVTFYNHKFYYKHTRKNGWNARGDKLTGAQAYNYLVENMPTNPDTPSYLYRQITNKNSKIPNVPPAENRGSQSSSQKAYKIAFNGTVGDYFKPISMDGKTFYVLSGVFIPSKSWAWNGKKMTVAINKADTYYGTKLEWTKEGLKTVKGDPLSGEELFNYLKGSLSSQGFEELSN